MKNARKLSDLIASDHVLGDDIYPLMAVIERRDPKTLTKSFSAFSPSQVLSKTYDETLQEGDQVRFFSMQDIHSVMADHPLLQTVSQTSSSASSPSTLMEDAVLTAFVKERAVFVKGAVRRDGGYPVVAGATLEHILAVAGGIALEGNKQSIEISSKNQPRRTVDITTEDPASIVLNPGATIRVNQTFHKIAEKSVTLLGEVAHPGQYDLMPGDTLSKLIERAGGLLDHAYPDGAIFSREAERKQEQNRYRALAQDLSLKLAASLQKPDDKQKPDAAQIQTMESLIAQLQQAKAVGRITIEADPASLKADPAQDILLESGDRIFIPKRPLTVRVAGEVFSPAALQFRAGKTAHDYIAEAGGTTYFADRDRAFIVYPDGSAQPLRAGLWQHSDIMIPPGSTLIVPRDPKPFDFLEGAERVSQILANLAISGLYIEAIGDDD